MSRKILLVHENEFEIDKLAALLRDEYDVFTAVNAEDAFKLLNYENIEMIFADIKLEMSDGKSFLVKTNEIFPNVIKIILGGTKEEQIVFKAIQNNIAKTCILKPWNEKILMVSNNVFKTEERIRQPKLLSYFRDFKELPTIHESYQRILQLIDSDGEIEDIAEAIEGDPSISLKLLRIANSAYYGVKTNSIKQAITYLGFINLRDLVLSTAVFDMFNSNDVPETIFQPLWKQAFMCSKVVNVTYKLMGKRAPVYASLAGLLMNIGSIFLLNKIGKDYMKIIQQVKQLEGEQRKKSIEDFEMEALGTTHGEIGGYLLGLWEIPYPIVETALYHCDPLNENILDKELLCILHLAQQYTAKIIYMDCSTNNVEECFKYLSIQKGEYERKIDELLYN
jgi:HD-like signal output (HDOD) protein/CheY-like chemotaxis protein